MTEPSTRRKAGKEPLYAAFWPWIPGGQFLVDVDSEAGIVVRPHHAVADHWCSREDFVGDRAEEECFLDTEIGAGQIEMQVGGVADRGDVARSVPSGADTEELTEVGQFAGRGESTDCRNVDPDEIDQAVLDEHFPFACVHEELAHCQRNAGGFPHASEVADVLRSGRVFQEEESVLLKLLCEVDGKDRLDPFVNVVQQFDFVPDCRAEVLKQFRYDADVGRFVPGPLIRARGCTSAGSRSDRLRRPHVHRRRRWLRRSRTQARRPGPGCG